MYSQRRAILAKTVVEAAAVVAGETIAVAVALGIVVHERQVSPNVLFLC